MIHKTSSCNEVKIKHQSSAVTWARATLHQPIRERDRAVNKRVRPEETLPWRLDSMFQKHLDVVQTYEIQHIPTYSGERPRWTWTEASERQASANTSKSHLAPHLHIWIWIYHRLHTHFRPTRFSRTAPNPPENLQAWKSLRLAGAPEESGLGPKLIFLRAAATARAV